MRLPLDAWQTNYNADNAFGRDSSNDTPDFYPQTHLHIGSDFVVPAGTPVYAPVTGKMMNAFWSPSKGWVGHYVFVFNGKTYGFEICHLSRKPIVRAYLAGEIMAATGETGSAVVGAHLHCCLYKDGLINATLEKLFSVPAGKAGHDLAESLIADGTIIEPWNFFNNAFLK